MKISIGPIQYFWERAKVLDFYQQAAECPAQIIYLGEVVCAKRRLIKHADWLAIGRELKQAGKQVVLSTMTLLEAASESSQLRKICEEDGFLIEANDISAVQRLSTAGKPFVTGPSVNIYNQHSLALLAGKELIRWVLPVELGLDTLRDLQSSRPDGVETEVFAFGRLPLAYSARCYTARSHHLTKDECQFHCLEYPDGRLLETREDEAFLVLNGIQTQSALTHHVLGSVTKLKELSVDILRISPQFRHSFRIIGIFDAVINGDSAETGAAELGDMLPLGPCNGYLHSQAGMYKLMENIHGPEQAC
jgi:collagenase-like PrtC family protease